MERGTILLLFVDAFAFDYLEKRPLLPGFWDEMLPLETLLGYSSSLVPALWSGCLPDQLNSWNEFVYQPRKPYQLIHWVDKLPNHYVRDFFRLLLYRYGSYDQALPTVPASVEACFMRTPVHYYQMPPVPLGEFGLDARLRRAGIPFHFWYPAKPFCSGDLLEDLEQALDKARVFIYGTATIDSLGHIFGPNPRDFDATIGDIETFIKGAHRLLEARGPVTIIMLSDHGMTSITKHFDLLEWLKPWRLGHDYLVFLDATMARFWDVGKVPLAQIRERLAEAGVGRFLDSCDRSHYGLNFHDNRFGDEVYLLKPNWVFSPSFMDSPNIPFLRREIKGMHGYEPSADSSTRAVFLYHGASPLPYKPIKITDPVSIVSQLLEL